MHERRLSNSKSGPSDYVLVRPRVFRESTFVHLNMTLPMVVTLAVLAGLLYGLVKDKPADVMFVAAVVFLAAFGVIGPDDAFSGFANSGMLIVAALFVVAAGLRETGVMEYVGERFLGHVETEAKALFYMAVVLIPSAMVLNNTPKVALLIPVIVWLDYYADETPGVQALDNATTILGWKSEPQPDGLLRILPEYGGRTWNEGGFIHGAPELVVEVSKTTRYVDLGPKLRDYERAGVLEYVVRAIDPDEIFWFGQEQGVLVQRSISEDGLYRSTLFSGLWLDPQALLQGNRRRLRAVLDLGCDMPEHAAFVAKLAAAKGNA